MAAQNSKLWHLEQINLFKNLSDEELVELDDLTVMKTADKNQFIYFPKEPSKILFFLKAGRIKIGSYSEDGKEIIKAILYPGEVFGEMGIVGEESRKDFAVAMDSETRMCTLHVDQFKKMMEANSQLSLEVTKNIGEKLRNIERRLESLIFKDARERIIDFMKEMAGKYGKKIGVEVLVKHDLTHQDIANLTATSRQTVTTVLNDLKEKDLIYMERKRFLIREIDKLA
ncbi:MAG: CRP-like cAMP-binding protein [Vicingaceae bacterium]|jgi:CRP-like cAMP-binding protein